MQALLRHHPSVFLTTPEMVQYWTEMMDMMAFVLPLDQNEILCEVRICYFIAYVYELSICIELII